MATYQGPFQGNEMFKSFTKTWHSEPYPSISPSLPDLSLAEKVIFITGGGTGIGKATAIAFAQAGARAIAIFGRRLLNLQLAAQEISEANPAGTTTVIFESVDIGQRVALENAFTSAHRKAGGTKIDVFVNNAASLKPLGPVATYSETEWRESIETNLMGPFHAVQAIMPLLSPKAKILNVSSGIAHINPVPGHWVYASLKTTTIKMFDYLQLEHPDLDIFNIQPGVIISEINQVSGFPGQDDVQLAAHFNLWITSPNAKFLKGKFVWANWDVDELKALSQEIENSMLLRLVLNGVPM